MLARCEFCGNRVRKNLLALHYKHCPIYRRKLKNGTTDQINLKETKRTGNIVIVPKVTTETRICTELMKDAYTATQLKKNLNLDWTISKITDFLMNEELFERVGTRNPLKFRTKVKSDEIDN